jgi:hypothetical protein
VQKRSLISFFVLTFTGAALFICSAFLYPQFVELIKVLTSSNDVPVLVSGAGWLVTFLVGILWLLLFVLFEIAKEELLSLARA